MTRRCTECQHEDGEHSFACSKYKGINYPEDAVLDDFDDDLLPLEDDEPFEQDDDDFDEDDLIGDDDDMGAGMPVL